MKRKLVPTLILAFALSGCALTIGGGSSETMQNSESDFSSDSWHDSGSSLDSSSFVPPVLPDPLHLEKYTAVISNAVSMGLIRGDSVENRRAARDDGSSVDDAGYSLVKTTSQDDPLDPSANADGSVDVLLTSIEESDEDLTGERTVIASSKDDDTGDISFVSRDKGSIVIMTDELHEYRLLSPNGKEPLGNWKKGTGSEITFTASDAGDLYEKNMRTLKVESRSLDAMASIAAEDNFEYTILSGDGKTVLGGPITDNGGEDADPRKGVVGFDGLVEGETYVIRYEGKGKEDIVSIDDLAEGYFIDKLAVLGDFTFLQFSDSDFRSLSDVNIQYEEGLRLESFDYNIPYDLCNYRTSHDAYHAEYAYVLDNRTGLIYSIPEEFFIQKINYGCVIAEDTTASAYCEISYRYFVNDNNELVFEPLYSNQSIFSVASWTDKYGTSYVRNNVFEGYDSEKNVYYFKDQGGEKVFERTSDGGTILLDASSGDGVTAGMTISDNPYIVRTFCMDADGKPRNLNENDNFDIYPEIVDESGAYEREYFYGVLNGELLWGSIFEYSSSRFKPAWGGTNLFVSSSTEDGKRIVLTDSSGNETDDLVNGSFLKENGSLLFYRDEYIYEAPYFIDASVEALANFEGGVNEDDVYFSIYQNDEGNLSVSFWQHAYEMDEWGIETEVRLTLASIDCRVVFGPCKLYENFPIRYELDGTIYYEFHVVESEDGSQHIEAFANGTYYDPLDTLTLIPVNR